MVRLTLAVQIDLNTRTFRVVGDFTEVGCDLFIPLINNKCESSPNIYTYTIINSIVTATPTPNNCNEDVKTCHNDFKSTRDPQNNCDFYPCPDLDGCEDDTKRCADGSFVGSFQVTIASGCHVP